MEIKNYSQGYEQGVVDCCCLLYTSCFADKFCEQEIFKRVSLLYVLIKTLICTFCQSEIKKVKLFST